MKPPNPPLQEQTLASEPKLQGETFQRTQQPSECGAEEELHLPLDQRLALSISEVAALLGVSSKTIRRLIARGLLRPSRALRHIRISRVEVLRYLKDTTIS